MATDVEKAFEAIGKMTVLELVELKKKIEEGWGVTAAAPVAVRPRRALPPPVATARLRRRRRIPSTSCSPAPATRRSR